MLRQVCNELLSALALAVALSLAVAAPAFSLSIELKDAAPDRVERQRAAAHGSLPLPGTPDIVGWQERLNTRGLKVGAAIFIRAFKAESELEVWMQKGDRFVLFATYPVCNWSGTLGPKLREGDRQTPEGFYTVSRSQIYHVGRWPHSLNLGFPNIYDQSQARTGSHILIHGGCTSVGCYAMTNPIMDEIYNLTKAALAAGQKHIPVHAFPFRMTDANMKAAKEHPWRDFWANLKEGYDSFARTRRPPRVTVCNNTYKIADRAAGDDEPGPINACAETIAEIKAQQDWLNQLPRPKVLAALRRDPLRGLAMARTLPGLEPSKLGGPVRPNLLTAKRRRVVQCSPLRPSCRRHLYLTQQRASASQANALRGKYRTRKPPSMW